MTSSDDLERLLIEPLSGGLIEVGDSIGVGERRAAAGWSVRTAAGFTDKVGFYREIAAALEFPGYAGHNLDALWDCLTDLPAGIAVIIDWRPFSAADPGYAARVRATLTERVAVEPAFAVVLA